MIKVEGERFVCTGGAGFIGSHLVEELRKQGKQVWSLDDYSAGRAENLQYAPDPFDITEDSLYPVKWDAIFHQACSKNTVCVQDPMRDLMVNAWGSFRIFKAAYDVGAKVIHASTGSVYGDSGIQHEATQYAPKSFYGVSKLAGEQYLRAFKEYYGLRFVGLRYFHVFGERQDSGPNGGVVPIFITKMLRKEPITVFGDGEQVRSFTYVKDVVRANFIAANSKAMEGEYFNVASGVQIRLNTLIDTLSEIMGIVPKVEYVPAKPGDIRDFNVSNSKIARFGMSEWTSFEDGLQKTVDWYKHAN